MLLFFRLLEIISNFSKCIEYCIKNKDDVKQKGKQAKIDSEEFLWSKKVKRFNDVYKKLMDNKIGEI